MFKEKFEEYIKQIDNHLHSLLDEKEGLIYDAMRYSLYAGGKRIRPVITLACAEALGGNMNAALTYACAIEMIHTYSLIHDDLPCMDNDDLRRGKPTNHVVYGEATAVLAGDALLNFACESVLSSDNQDSKMQLAALKIIYNAAGAEGMIGGQILDMEAETKKISGEELSVLHKKKTGALICASAALGAISSGKDVSLFEKYALALGLAFQIRDDILDIEGDVETFGKPILSDEKNSKTTYVTLYGMDGAKEILKEETQNAIDALEFLEEKGEFLKELAKYLLDRKN